MSNLFEVLAHEDDADQARISGNRAVIAAQTRVQDRFAQFVANAADQADRDARLGLLDDEIREVVAAIVEEYGAEDPERVYLAATAVLGGGHAADCSCGFCENKGSFGKDDESDDEGEDDTKEASVKVACSCCEDCGGDGCNCSNHKESKTAADFPGHDYSIEGGEHVKNWNPEEDQDAAPVKEDTSKDAWHNAKTAAAAVGDVGLFGFVPDEVAGADHFAKIAAGEVEDGDTFVTERLDLGASKDGVEQVGSPKIDKSKVPASGLSEIDVPSNAHPSETQSVTDRPNFDAALPGPSETGKSIDADSPLQPEHNVADDTATWSGTEGQAAPVTSKLAKWQIVNT